MQFQAKTERRRILIVDDHPGIAEGLHDLLTEEGHEVYSARDGEEALDHLRNSLAPDLIFLDLMMPRMNGWRFLIERQQDPALAAIPVIVTSGICDPAPAAGLGGAVGFLQKPFTAEAILEAVRQHALQRPSS